MKGKILGMIMTLLLTLAPCGAEARIFLVSAGVADYSGFPAKITNLRLPAKDAKTVADLYAKNTSVDYALLVNEKATKDRILRAIRKVFNTAGEDDIVVFFFSGHGYPGGFCAYDGKLGYDEIRSAMSESKSRNKMMFVDACRSGGMRVDKETSGTAMKDAKNANVMLFLSSHNNENSIERRDMANGFFTTFLQKGLRGNADRNRDRTITAKELFEFVHEGVSRLSGGKQHPVMWGKFNDSMPVMKW